MQKRKCSRRLGTTPRRWDQAPALGTTPTPLPLGGQELPPSGLASGGPGLFLRCLF